MAPPAPWGSPLPLLVLLVGMVTNGAAKECRPLHPLNSRILLHQSRHGKAGLGDRMFIFEKMGNLAASLGAMLAVSAPHTLLSPHHNMGREVKSDARWSDYIDTVFNDGTPILTDSDRIGTTHAVELDGLLSHAYDAALQLHRANITFIWHVHGNFYDYNNGLQQHILRVAAEGRPSISLNIDEPLCNYCQVDFSHKLKERAMQFIAAHKLVPGCYLGMHLRRGDIVGNPKECNSSVPQVVSHVQCALRQLLHTNMTIVLFTNGDTKYVQEVIEAIGTVYSGRVFHGDPDIAASGGDNFVVYMTGHFVRAAAFSVLALDRWWCDPCPPAFQKKFDTAKCIATQ